MPVVVPGIWTHHNDNAATMKPSAPVVCEGHRKVVLPHRRPSRAVIRSRNSGTSGVLGVSGTKSITRYSLLALLGWAAMQLAIGRMSWASEFTEPVDALHAVVVQRNHRTRRMFRPREQEWLAHASIITPPPGCSPEGI